MPRAQCVHTAGAQRGSFVRLASENLIMNGINRECALAFVACTRTVIKTGDSETGPWPRRIAPSFALQRTPVASAVATRPPAAAPAAIHRRSLSHLTAQVAMLFEVSCRESDIGFNDDSKTFLRYHTNSCEAFKKYAGKFEGWQTCFAALERM